MGRCEVCGNEYDKAFKVIRCAHCAALAAETGLRNRA